MPEVNLGILDENAHEDEECGRRLIEWTTRGGMVGTVVDLGDRRPGEAPSKVRARFYQDDRQIRARRGRDTVETCCRCRSIGGEVALVIKERTP